MPSVRAATDALEDGFETDLSSESFYQDPYPAYRCLRETAPVYWSPSWRSWLVTRFADCDAILRDAARFSNANRFGQILDSIPELEQHDSQILRDHVQLGVANADRPEHTRLRSLMAQGFHPRDIEPMQEYVAGVVDELLEDVDGRELDLAAALARPLSAIVISDILGIAREERHRFKALIDATSFHGTGSALGSRAVGAVDALGKLTAWLEPLVLDRRNAPRGDMLSRLVAATDRGGILSDSELVTTCIVIVRAGQTTTEGLIGNAIVALLRNRDQWRLIVDDPSLVPGAVEEALRYDTSFLRTLRRVVTDVELHGQVIPAGDLVSVMLGAANRDPDRYDQPDVFDIRRDGIRHLGFGVGSHFCLGAPLARLEAAAAIGAIARRWPGLALRSAAVEWQADNVMRAPTAVLVTR
jgi:cytochrome P450